MPLVLGIDEAGYGPLLGPLVIGATLWRVSTPTVTGDFWTPLAEAVCRRSGRGESRLPVGDSKQIFDRKKGLATLERTVLGFAHAVGLPTGTLRDLLRAVGFESPGTAHPMPWYQDLDRRLPVDPSRSAFEGAASRLQRTMQAAGVACVALRTEIITEDVFNRRVTSTRNKAAVLLEAILRLMHWAASQAGASDVYVHIDRLGGRADYRELLMRAFPDRHLHVVEVGERQSRYRLAAAANDWHVDFTVNGDAEHLPIALASMLAKYVRELLMERFNMYWQALAPELTPTAGYYQDAQRFLSDIRPLVARTGLRAERFVRAR